MADRALIVLAPKAAALATVNIHGLQELFLAIHAHELDVSVAARCWMIPFVFIACIEDYLCLLLHCLYFSFDLIDRFLRGVFGFKALLLLF